MEALPSFEPSREQALAKSRVYRWLDARHGILTVDQLTLDELVTAAGTSKVRAWLQEPDFAAWLFERDAFGLKVNAVREAALEVVVGLATDESGVTAPKDRLKAAELLLNLAGAFPAKQREVRFLDRELESMPDDQVERELAEIQEQLKAAREVK